jgi:putative hydrolase
MKIEADLHVHTVASGHAFSTITEVCLAARKKELKAVALLDHGPALPGGAHEYYFSNLIVLPEEIEGVRVFKGAEANIVNEKGRLDISDFTLELLEFVGISFHPACGYEPGPRAQNTEVLIKAMENPNVRLICHPNVPGFEVDQKAVVEAALEKGVLIEINNYSFNENSFRYPSLEENLRLIEICAEVGCPVALNSDAHYHEFVGDVSKAAFYLEKVLFPEELIVNRKFETFLSYLYRFFEQRR